MCIYVKIIIYKEEAMNLRGSGRPREEGGKGGNILNTTLMYKVLKNSKQKFLFLLEEVDTMSPPWSCQTKYICL